MSSADKRRAYRRAATSFGKRKQKPISEDEDNDVERVMEQAETYFEDKDYEGLQTTDTTTPGDREKKLKDLPLQYRPRMQKAIDLQTQEKPDFESALSIFSEIAEAVPEYAPVYTYMVECCKRLGRVKDALHHASECVSVDENMESGWVSLMQLARELKPAGDAKKELVRGLKGVVTIKTLSNEDKYGYLQELVELLEDTKDGSAVTYQVMLLELEPLMGRSDSERRRLQLTLDIAEKLRAAKKPERIVECLDELVELTSQRIDSDPENARLVQRSILIYLEALIDVNKAGAVLTVMTDLDAVSLQTSETGSTRESVTVKEPYRKPEFVALICVSLLKVGDFRFPTVERLIAELILTAKDFTEHDQIIRLVTLLLDTEHGDLARRVLEHCISLTCASRSSPFHSPKTLMLMGKIHETLDDLKTAVHTYEKIQETEPSYRPVQHRLSALKLEFPHKLGKADVGPLSRKRTAAGQKELYQRCLNTEDEEAYVDAVAEFVESTFDQATKLDAGTFLWPLKTPYALEKGLKRYKLSAAVISEKEITVDEFWNVIIRGCELAFKHERFGKMLEIAFTAIRTKEAFQHGGKMDVVKWALVVASYRLPPGSTPDPVTGDILNPKAFAYNYMRESINRRRTGASFPRPVWNFFYHIATDPDVVDQKVMVKWASHWAKKYGYDKHIALILANDSMKRGSYIPAYALYTEITKKEREEDIPWSVWLHLGILCANLSCRFRLPANQRGELATLAMKHLETYGNLRGHCPEVLFNKARACQRFGDFDRSIQYYKDCLDLLMNTSGRDGESAVIGREDLFFEVAYNLRAIYVHKERVENVKEVSSWVLDWQTMKSLCGLNLTE